MVKELQVREFGVLCPRKFQRIFTDKVNDNFRLSRVRFPRNYKGSILSIDVDQVYGQYILTASAPNSIRVHNLLIPHSDTLNNLKNVSKNLAKLPMRLSHETVTCVQWYPNSINVLTSSGKDGCLKVWDVGRRHVSVEVKPFPSRKVRIAQHHQSLISKVPLVAVASSEPGIPILDLRFGNSTMRLKNIQGPVTCCRWSPLDENCIASAAESTVHIWDVRIPSKPLFRLDINNSSIPSSSCVSHLGMVNSLEFSPDGLKLATYGTDCSVRLWNTKNGRLFDINCGYLENTARTCVRMAFNRGSRLFVPSRHEIKFFDLQMGEMMGRLKGHMADIYYVQYNPLYESLHSAGRDRNVLTWCYPKVKKICSKAEDDDSEDEV